MAYETEKGNVVTQTDVISDAISAALVKKAVVAKLYYSEDVPANTAVKKFRKDGSLTAEEIAESAAYTFSASSEYTQSSVTATATKFGVVSKQTVENQRFTDLTPAKIYQEQGNAIARDLDDEFLALHSGFSQSVTSSTVLTVADLLQACYVVISGTAGVSAEGKLVATLDFKGVNEIKKELMASGAAVFTQQNMTSLLAGVQAANGYVGSLPGLDIFQTVGLPTGGGDDTGLVADPNIALAAMVDPSIQIMAVDVISGGFYKELGSYTFADVVEWNDAAGCAIKSDT